MFKKNDKFLNNLYFKVKLLDNYRLLYPNNYFEDMKFLNLTTLSVKISD